MSSINSDSFWRWACGGFTGLFVTMMIIVFAVGRNSVTRQDVEGMIREADIHMSKDRKSNREEINTNRRYIDELKEALIQIDHNQVQIMVKLDLLLRNGK